MQSVGSDLYYGIDVHWRDANQDPDGKAQESGSQIRSGYDHGYIDEESLVGNFPQREI